MKLKVGDMYFSFESAEELLPKLKAASERLDKKISGYAALEKKRRLILKALREFKENLARPKEQ